MLAETIQTMQRMYGLLQQLAATTHDLVGKTHEMHEITNEIRDHIANFEDFWRPIRNYLHWEPHCYDIPICFSLRSIFDSIDGVDEVTDKLGDLVKNLDQIDVIMPQLLSQFPEMIAIMQSMQTMMLTMHSTMSGVFGQMDDNSGNSTAMGKAFDTAQNDDSFYIPPEVFKNPDFQRVIYGSRELVRSALFHHHARYHPKLYCRSGHRGYGRTFVGRIIWAVSADLAICSRHHIALDGASDVRDHPFGGGV